MKTLTLFLLPALCSLLLVSGCASSNSGPDRTIRYTVPPVPYEQHEPGFSHDPLTNAAPRPR